MKQNVKFSFSHQGIRVFYTHFKIHFNIVCSWPSVIHEVCTLENSTNRTRKTSGAEGEEPQKVSKSKI